MYKLAKYLSVVKDKSFDDFGSVVFTDHTERRTFTEEKGRKDTAEFGGVDVVFLVVCSDGGKERREMFQKSLVGGRETADKVGEGREDSSEGIGGRDNVAEFGSELHGGRGFSEMSKIQFDQVGESVDRTACVSPFEAVALL